MAEKFGVYLMDENGRYDDPIWLDALGAVTMARKEMANYHEIRVTDQSDCVVFHTLEGKIAFPTRHEIREHYPNQN